MPSYLYVPHHRVLIQKPPLVPCNLKKIVFLFENGVPRVEITTVKNQPTMIVTPFEMEKEDRSEDENDWEIMGSQTPTL